MVKTFKFQKKLKIERCEVIGNIARLPQHGKIDCVLNAEVKS